MNRVLSLKIVQSSVKVNGETVAIDPLLLFQRISLNIKSVDDVKSFLEYELAPFPMSLFTENGMKKNVKSELYKEFTSIKELPPSDLIMHVVDGGFLLHKVVWKKGDTIQEILKKYINYVLDNFKRNSWIIFDGYPEADTVNSGSVAISTTTGTKNSERQRRKNTVQVIPAFEFQSCTKIPFCTRKISL